MRRTGGAMKVVVIVVAVVFLLLIASVAAGLYFVDSIAKGAIETQGTKALGVETTLQSADVGVFAGRFSMDGLHVDNPQGFTSPHFMKLGQGGVAVSLGSLMEDTVRLPELTLTGLDVNLERKDGASNVQAILAHIKSQSTPKPTPDPGAPKKEGKKFTIDTLTIRDVNVHVNMTPELGEATKLDIKIPEILLTDVGSGGAKPMELADVVGVVVQAVLTAVAQNAGGLIPEDLLGSLRAQLGELPSLESLGVDLEAQVGEVIDDVIKDGSEQLDDAIEDATKDLPGGLRELGEGLRNPRGTPRN